MVMTVYITQFFTLQFKMNNKKPVSDLRKCFQNL